MYTEVMCVNLKEKLPTIHFLSFPVLCCNMNLMLVSSVNGGNGEHHGIKKERERETEGERERERKKERKKERKRERMTPLKLQK